MALGLAKRASREARAQTAVVKSLGAPTGGLNARDALASMPPSDAIVLDNWFPTPSFVQVRNGNEVWSSGYPSVVETVMAYNGVTARKLFAASNNSFYDATVQGAVGAAVVTGLTNNRWQAAMFNAGGGSVLIAVNGADAPLRYDGGAQGTLETLGTLVGGAGYVNGTYVAVPLTGGTGVGAQGIVTVTGGAVTQVTLTMAGLGYTGNDVLTASNANLGGTGAGFSILAQTVGGWSVTTLSGTNVFTGAALPVANLITVTVFKQRLWFIEQNTMNVWYTGVSAYQGPLTQLPLGTIFKMGGFLMQMATWTIDNVSGINDYAAFITSEGEVAIYQGYDPSAVATWSLVGVFHMGRPIGRRCILKFGSDVLVVCMDGLAPLSKSLLTDRTQPDVLLTNKIINAISLDLSAYAQNFGWQCIEHPLGNKLILNVPESATQMHQWVMNTVSTSNAWCRFVGWNASCWEVQQDSLYYGAANAVYLADVGASDSGGAITADCKPAFSYFDSMQEKRFLMARPNFRASSPFTIPPIKLNLDFNDVVNPAPVLNVGGVALWNVSPWNTTPWAGIIPNRQVKNWLGVTGIGYAASGRITFSVNEVAVQWQSIDYMYEPGGPL